MRKILKSILVSSLALLLLFSLSACGSVKYSKLGISFEIPKRFEPRAIAGAAFAYGDDESFIVFTRRTRSELLAGGLSEINVSEFTDRFLTENGMKDAVEVNYTTDRPEAFCPVCGSFSRLDETKCYLCKHPLVDPERKNI